MNMYNYKNYLVMDKQSKFNLLREIALSRDEAEEYFDLQEMKNSNSNKIFLPMSVVYENKRKCLRVLPYLDLSQKDKVWGISFHGILIHRLQIEAVGYDNLNEKLNSENALCDKYSRLRTFPSLCDWERFFARGHEFNDMMAHFRRHGIAANDLETGTIFLSARGILCSFSPELAHLSFVNEYDTDTPMKSRFVVYL